MIDDSTLLRRYASDRAEDAFAELVRRHLPLVYSAAVRRLSGDTHRAEDVAQVVFSTVARDAHRLAQHTVLTGWLYTTTRNAVIDVLRTEQRRRGREEEAHGLQQISAGPEDAVDWSRLRPVLDAAMDELRAEDREAVLLRFFQARPFADIGAALGLSEDAARKRVERALDQLGDQLRRRKIASTAAALAALLAGETIAATPAGLAPAIASTVLATGGAAAGAAAFFTAAKLKVGLAAVVIGGGAVGLVTQQRAISALNKEVDVSQRQIVALTTENARLVEANTRAVPTSAASGRSDAAPVATAFVQSTAVPDGAAAPTAGSRTPINPARLAQYQQRFGAFVRQRGLTPEQADRLFAILSEWDDVSRDFQAAIRTQGLVWTPEAQRLRNRLQHEIENRPLTALLGEDGRRAYFEFEASSFHRALLGPFTRALASENLPLSDVEITRLVELVKSHKRTVRPDPSSMSSEAVVEWEPVIATAAGFLTPAQIAVMRTELARRTRSK